MVAARNALNLSTEIIGVTATASAAAALSFKQRKLVESPARIRNRRRPRLPQAQLGCVGIIWANVARIVEVSDAEIAEAMRIYYEDTHNVAEGAGAAPLAAALQEKASLGGKRAGIILTGGNVDRELFVAALRDGEHSSQ